MMAQAIWLEGCFMRASTRIQAVESKTVYVHCNSHVLNLCVAACCKLQPVRNMMETARLASAFFNFSPKRNHLQNLIEELSQIRNELILSMFVRPGGLLELTVLCLFKISCFCSRFSCHCSMFWGNWKQHWLGFRMRNEETTQKASCLYHSIFSFELIMTLVVTCRCLEITRLLTLPLQHSAIDAGFAREKVSLVYGMLEKYRTGLDEWHAVWYAEATALAESCETTPAKLRTPAKSVCQYYCWNLAIPFLDHLMSQVTHIVSPMRIEISWMHCIVYQKAFWFALIGKRIFPNLLECTKMIFLALVF